MPAARGSRQAIAAVREATFGTPPANPTMYALPIVSFNRNVNRGVIRSNQMKAHPFTDKLMPGGISADFDMQIELQDETHDILLSAVCGTTDWASDEIKVTDTLQGLSMQAEAADLGLFDIFGGGYLSTMELNFPAEENGIVTATFNGQSRTVSLDSTTSLVGTGSIVPAPEVDPFVYSGATVTIAGDARPVTALTIRLERQVDPLLVLGSATPREYIPSTVTLTGQVTIPLEDDTESTQLMNFTEMPLVARAADFAGTAWREFTMPKINFLRMGRQVQDRGVILQSIDYEAKFDVTSSSVMTIGRSA
jgi:hypothetical protein